MNTFSWILLFTAWGLMSAAIVCICAFSKPNDYVNKIKD